MKEFTKNAVHIIKHIPAGKVMTYGQVAALAGSPRAARQVVRVLHSLSEKHQLPWHRVINAQGKIGFHDEASFEEQRMRLMEEDIELGLGGCVDLGKYQYNPDWSL